MFRKTLLLLSLCAVGASCATAAKGPQQVTPQRPFPSNDTKTVSDGTLEVEAGIQARPDKLFRAPVNLRLGATESTEVFFEVPVYEHFTLPGDNLSGIGNLVVGTRTRFLDESKELPAFAYLISARLPTGSNEVSTGNPDFIGAFIAEKNWKNIDWKANYRLSVIGDPDETGTELESGFILGGRGWVDKKLSVASEFDLFYGTGDLPSPAVLNTSVGYNLNPAMRFDIGIALALNDDALDYYVTAGITTNLGGIF